MASPRYRLVDVPDACGAIRWRNRKGELITRPVAHREGGGFSGHSISVPVSATDVEWRSGLYPFAWHREDAQ